MAYRLKSDKVSLYKMAEVFSDALKSRGIDVGKVKVAMALVPAMNELKKLGIAMEIPDEDRQTPPASFQEAVRLWAPEHPDWIATISYTGRQSFVARELDAISLEVLANIDDIDREMLERFRDGVFQVLISDPNEAERVKAGYVLILGAAKDGNTT